MMKSKKTAAMLTALLLCTVMLMCACVPYATPSDAILPDLIESVSEESHVASGIVASNEYIVIREVISITPTDVAAFGELTEKGIEDGVTAVRISGSGDMESVQKCENGYFLIPFNLPGKSKANFTAMALKDEEELGDPLPFAAPYDSTAQQRLDGKSVTIGSNSQMYFSKYLNDYLCKELYTASQVRAIKKTVTDTYKAYVEKANGGDVSIIYVFLPDVTTMDPSIILEEDRADKDEGIHTRYEQIREAIGGTKAKVVDMQAILQEQLDGGMNIYDLYRRTDSHPTEYTSFLMYQEVMKYIAEADPDVNPRTLDNYNMTQKKVQGGDYAAYRGLDPDIVIETITLLEPKFSLQDAIAAIRLYSSTENNDYSLFTTIDAADRISGGAERLLVSTERTELPNLLIYRDENAIGASLLLADSCDQTLLARVGDYFVSLTDATQYRDKEEGKNVVDFIVVFVSESNIGSAFTLE